LSHIIINVFHPSHTYKQYIESMSLITTLTKKNVLIDSVLSYFTLD
jgi:hypothetical protein